MVQRPNGQKSQNIATKDDGCSGRNGGASPRDIRRLNGRGWMVCRPEGQRADGRGHKTRPGVMGDNSPEWTVRGNMRICDSRANVPSNSQYPMKYTQGGSCECGKWKHEGVR